MSCADSCHFEATCQHELSPGVVRDEEEISRASYTPMHTGGRAKVRKSLIRAGDLRENRGLSFWRISVVGDEEGVREKLRGVVPAKNEINSIHHAKVKDIRDFRFDNDSRVFCVIDDCICDENGGGDDLLP